MKRPVFLARAVAGSILIGAAGCGGDAAAPNADVTDVYASGAIYTPASAEISAGGTVRFHLTATSEGEGHNAIFSHATGAPADINIFADTTVARVFSTPGTFAYICTVHPGMGGEIVVH